MPRKREFLKCDKYLNASAAFLTPFGHATMVRAISGGVLGWLVDRMVGTAPWGLIVCLILGFAAGMLNLLRATGSVKSARTDGK